MENLKDPAVSFTVILQRKGKIPFCNLSYISYGRYRYSEAKQKRQLVLSIVCLDG